MIYLMIVALILMMGSLGFSLDRFKCKKKRQKRAGLILGGRVSIKIKCPVDILTLGFFFFFFEDRDAFIKKNRKTYKCKRGPPTTEASHQLGTV
jgi:hypothetical protein